MSSANITVILGSIREGRTSENAAKFIVSLLQNRENVEVRFVDSRTLHLDSNLEGPALGREKNQDFLDTLSWSNGFVFVFPEYNHSFPGIFKRVIDMGSSEYFQKPVAFCGVSSGMFGGVRAIEAFLAPAKTLGLLTQPKDLYIFHAESAFDGEGNPTNPMTTTIAEEVIDQLLSTVARLS